jgi:hypothetical protein
MHREEGRLILDPNPSAREYKLNQSAVYIYCLLKLGTQMNEENRIY